MLFSFICSNLNADGIIRCGNRVEGSVIDHEISHPPRGSHDLHVTRGAIVNNRFCATCGVNRCASIFKHVMLINRYYFHQIF